jgi:chromate transporter
MRVFSRLALLGFGGVLPIAQRELVERQRWLSTAEFAELLSLSQVLPGPNIINLALMFGDRHFGWRGALAALTGMIGLPLVLVLSLAALYQNLASVPSVQGALRGMGLVAAGLVLATALKLLPALRRHPLPATIWLPTTLAVAVFVGVLRWPLLAVLAGMGSLSCGLAWQALRRMAQERQR